MPIRRSSRDRKFPRFASSSLNEELAFKHLCSETGPCEGIPILPKLVAKDCSNWPAGDPSRARAQVLSFVRPFRRSQFIRRVAIAALLLAAAIGTWAGVTIVLAG